VSMNFKKKEPSGDAEDRGRRKRGARVTRRVDLSAGGGVTHTKKAVREKKKGGRARKQGRFRIAISWPKRISLATKIMEGGQRKV